MRALRLVGSTLSATLGFAVAIVLLPGRRPLALDVYLLVLGGLAILELAHAMRAAHPQPRTSQFERALRRTPVRPERPVDLTRLEREVTLAASNSFYLQARLCPLLREIADERLRERRGVDIERDPEAARVVLGPEAWDLVRPDRQRPADPHAPGLPLARLEAVVTTLEGL